jgi:predicted O-linked N-acetylglucosamine transferase (SPINDLY family)
MSANDLARATQLQQAGRLDEAEQIYRDVLRTDGAQADAWHLLGVVALQRGRFEEAVESIRRAISLLPASSIAHSNLGVAYKSLGRWDEAIGSYQKAISLQPGYAEAHFNLGLALHHQGQCEAAAAAHRQAVICRPDYAEAQNSLGQVLRELGRPEEAEAAVRQALSLRPNLAEAHVNLGNVLKDQGRPDAARASYEAALQQRPDLAEAHNNLGCLLQEAKQVEEAVSHFRAALRHRPQYIEAQHNLSRALVSQGDSLRDCGQSAAAQNCYEESLRLDPRCLLAHNNLGTLHLQDGRRTEARECFARGLQLDPRCGALHNNLGSVYLQEGNKAQAKASFEAAVRWEPSLAIAHDKLGALLLEEGESKRAQECFEKAVERDENLFSAHFNLGVVLAGHPRKLDQAERCFRRALELEPNSAAAHDALAEALGGQGDWQGCLASYARADEVAPTDLRRLRSALVLPIIPESVEQMHEHRRRVYANLARLLSAELSIPSSKDLLAIGTPDFFLAYHGEDEREFRERLARLYLRACPELAYTAPHCREPRQSLAGRPLKIGFVSRHLRNHTIGRLNAGLIERLDRSRFQVTVIRRERQDDELARRIDASADRVVTCPNPRDLVAARELIAEQELDVLFYPDIGMEPWTYLLAFARLASVQCVTWGHPITTGLSTVDYFISSEDLDLAEGQDSYTERLVRLPNLAVCYERPQLSGPGQGRRHFGLPEEAHLYGCLQSLFKFHPEFDPLLAQILRRDPAGVLVLIEGARQRWNELLLARLQKTAPDVVGRIRFVPPQEHGNYLALCALCDVMLDPLHFGGGNTSYEALALGVPVVTLPSRFLRGRITLAQYRSMHLTDCVVASPQEYVDLAVRLGTDSGFRRTVCKNILRASEKLYENEAGVRQLEEFLSNALASSVPPQEVFSPGP